ncbi:MAG: prolyl-tRNA synthetase associated domain-containing protein [Alphaproteobacteria bacterium]|nr:prolyl-tRNA synthetase associated domain-containing protein [Alphaproteobacteria bacterium]
MPATPEQLFARFEELGIRVETHRHDPVFTVDEAKALRGLLPGGHCKNLFLRNKKEQHWLVVCEEDRQVDLRRLGDRLGAGRLSFGSSERLMRVLGVPAGSVTPFALINDVDRKVSVVLDRTMMTHELLNYHPLDNTMTTAIARDDLVRFIEACGHLPVILDLDGEEQPAGGP